LLADRSKGRAVIATRYPTEADMQAGHEAFEAMSPPDVGSVRRVSVDMYEVLLERET
jgi:hypothetical protein